MNILLILDKDAKTEISEDLRAKIIRTLAEKGHQVEVIELRKNDALPCLGCFSYCLIEHPEECVHKDRVNEVKKNVKNYGATFFLTPVLFGHFGSTVKNAMDRGTGSHNWQVIIGYGSDIDDEEKNTFIDLIGKHGGSADIVHPGMVRQVDVFVTMSTSDNTAICEATKKMSLMLDVS